MDANEVQSKIKDQIKDNPILIYMKGSPYEPQCGFSARTVQALIECEAEFSYVDVLSNPDVRQNLPIVSEWPTFPQLYIGGELVGGCDIVTQLHASGELKKLVDSAAS
ncbi:MAG: Grx4 family monothiol glutaredoxin [Gammaproteobacteria bacterium]|jgi:monothiol glutaredoxin